MSISGTVVQKTFKPAVFSVYGKVEVDGAGGSTLITKNGGSVGVKAILQCDASAGYTGMYAVILEKSLPIAGFNEAYGVLANIHDVGVVTVPSGAPYVTPAFMIYAYGVSDGTNLTAGAPLGYQFIVIAMVDVLGAVVPLPAGVALFSVTASTNAAF